MCIRDSIRVFLVSVLFGTAVSLFYSVAGAVLSLGGMLLLKRTGLFSTVAVSVAGGVLHNIGQILMACLLLKAKMKSVRQGAEADVYVTAEGLDLTVRSDVYTHTTEVRRRKSNKDGAESGGGGSGRSGHY
mgnify:FL=1